jgi:alpha-galactosidase
MVSPDSDLHRANPDWCLHDAGRSRPTQRQQLVLDLSLGEVRHHIFGMLDRLLKELPIAYLKWDHNRDLFPALSGGRPASHLQTLGFYAVLDQVRAAHPAVEIESCASGGARIDFAVATRTARVWASDNTDGIERLRLQRAMSIFYPPEMIGSHFGAAPNPTTGRSLSLDFRARAAMFAHFGIEADPARLSASDRLRLAQHVEHYKSWRDLIHAGDLRYSDCDDPGVTVATISAPDGGEALALVARVDQSGSAVGPLIRFPGLCSGSRYGTTLLEPWPEHAARQLANGDFWRSRPLLDGALLKDVGLRLPIVHPETAWLIHLQRADR